MKKSLLSLILLFAIRHCVPAQYWNTDFRLPKLKGVRKIGVTETRWEEGSARPSRLSKSVLWLNKEGLVSREDSYEPGQTWRSSYTTYEYTGNDTVASVIRIFVYPNLILAEQKPGRTDTFIQSVEFVNDHLDPRHHEWRFYKLDEAGKKRLLNITATDYDSGGRAMSGLYLSFESGHRKDSTSYLHRGDTTTSTEYALDTRHEWREMPVRGRQEVSVHRVDSAGRLASAERISDTYSGMLRRSEFSYDRMGRYSGEAWKQQCSNCKSGWESGGERRSYDAKSRLKSIAHYVEAKPTLTYELVYFGE